MFHIILYVYVSSSTILDVVHGSTYEYPYIPPHVTPKLVEYLPYLPRGKDTTLDLLLGGQSVDTLDDVMLQTFVNISKVCDIARIETIDHNIAFTPSICSPRCDKWGILDEFTKKACADRPYYDSNTGNCCPVSEIPWYKTKFPEKNHFEWREMNARLRFHKNISLTAAERKRTGVVLQTLGIPPILNLSPSKIHGILSESFDIIKETEILNNPDFIQRFKKDVVCGISAKLVEKKGFPADPLAYDIDYNVFVCTQAAKCNDTSLRPDSDLRAAPEWHDHCFAYSNSRLDLEFREHCCHLQLLPLDYYHTERLSSWILPGIPTYTNFMPGLRATYACENYAKHICEGNDDLCVVNEQIEHYPFMARLGIVAPTVMLFHCLGTIISRRFILSSWTCRTKHGIDTNVALLGDDENQALLEDTNKEDIYIIIRSLNAHDEWKGPKIPSNKVDIALFRTSVDISFKPHIRPACIFYHYYPYEREGKFVSLKTDTGANSLYQAKTEPIQSGLLDGRFIANCQTRRPFNYELNPQYALYIGNSSVKWGEHHAYRFCVGNETAGTAPCQNVGAPLVRKMEHPYCSWFVKGVLVSERNNCTAFQFGIFENVTFFVEAIEDIVWPLPFLDFDFTRPSCRG